MTTRLASNAGMDAYEAQLMAAHQDAITNTATVDSYATETEMMNDSQSIIVESQLSATPEYPTMHHNTVSTSKHDIGGLLMQRAIQTQLYYLSDLRDEPTYVWLRSFLGHDHLDDRGRFNKLDGMRCPDGWLGYLRQLEQAPHFTITVELAPPRLSAQQKRNPYLAQQATGRSYEETIMPSKLSKTLRTVARSLEKEWMPVLTETAATDRKRVEVFEYPQLQTTAAAYQAMAHQQVVAGGEGDDQETPLHSLNCRIVTRFCTRVALLRVVEGIKGVSLPVEAADLFGDDDEETKRSMFASADAAAEQWLRDFSREWVPRLVRGADDERRRQLGVAPPGHWQRLCEGADADDVTEALWQELPQLFALVSDDAMRLYSPEALAARLRRVRANICDELVDELRAVVLEINELS